MVCVYAEVVRMWSLILTCFHRPAFWMVGPNWPYDGEIDIIEGVNDQTQNDMTLHSGPSCSISNSGGFSGSFVSGDCDSSGSSNQGCQIAATNTNTYGAGFNANNGGVYATEWTGSSISVWFFPRNSIPSDVTGSSPDPSSWGTPLAYFSGGCDIGTSFVSQQLVFDTTFCGDWAGNVWSSSSCAAQASTCDAFVQNNPSAFADAYWSVNALKVFSSSGSGSSPSVVPQSTTSAWVAPSVAQPSSVPVPTTFVVSTTPAIVSVPDTSAAAPTNWGWEPYVSGTGPIGENPGAAPTGGDGVQAAATPSSVSGTVQPLTPASSAAATPSSVSSAVQPFTPASPTTFAISTAPAIPSSVSSAVEPLTPASPTTFAVSTTPIVISTPSSTVAAASNWGWDPYVSGTGLVGENPGVAPTAAASGGDGVEAAAATASSAAETVYYWDPVITGNGPIGEEQEPAATADPFTAPVRARHVRHLNMHKRHMRGIF